MVVPVFEPQLGKDEEKQLKEAIRSGRISSSSRKTERFENKVKSFLDAETGFATDSGTAALYTALKAVGVSKGDKVVVPGLTFGATALAVRQVGAEPVLVDIEEERMCIDPMDLEDNLDSDVSAIIVVHLFGKPAEMDEIMEIALEKNIPVIEDSAQAFGSEYMGEKTGTIGDIGIFSFSWNKTLTTGKGGFVATDKSRYSDKIEELVCNGTVDGKKFSNTGYNHRLDSIRASIGLAQLDRYSEIRDRKNRLREYYEEELSSIGIGFMEEFENEELSPWALYILTDKRDKVANSLKKQDIDSRKFYPPLNELGIVSSERELEAAEKISRKGLILPSSEGVAGKEKVVKAVKKVLE